MPRKVFLSVLGTGPYSKTKYYFNNDQSTACETNFIQEASIRYFCKEWGKDDIIYILTTKDATKINWEHPAHKTNDRVTEKYDGLSEVMKRIKEDLKLNYEKVDIPDGNTEDEIWEIFNIVYNLLKDGDQLYIDITHSFRSLPMLITVLINYAKRLKDIEVKSITYGNFEVSKNNNGYSPVIDLTSFSFIDDLSIGVNNFVSFGNTEKLFRVTQDDLVPLIKNASKDKDISIKIKNIITQFNKFLQELQTVRGNNLYDNKTINNIKNDIIYLKDNAKAQYKPIIEEIENLVNKFDNENKIKNLLYSIELAIVFNLYQQAYSLIIETFLTFILCKLKLDINDRDKRELVKKALKIVYDKIEEQPEKWQGVKKD